MTLQATLFDIHEPLQPHTYKPVLTVTENGKGVLDVDTVKGCTSGMRAYPDGGCYGECYACKSAKRNGLDFSVSVTRRIIPWAWRDIFCAVRDHHARWYRIGVAGDPCHDWAHTLSVCETLRATGKTPVIITKHWATLSEEDIDRLRVVRAVVNTSTGGLDSDAEIAHRVRQIERVKAGGVRSVTRVVTCLYGSSDLAKSARDKQDYLLSLTPVIDNPLRVTMSNARVLSGDILIRREPTSRGGGKLVSLHDKRVYLGTCSACPDQCGA